MHQERLQEIYASLEEDRPTKRVKLLLEGQEQVKQQLEELREASANIAGGNRLPEGSCSYCRVPLSSERSR